MKSFQFDDFVADQSKRELWKQGREIKVRERTFRLISFLIQHRDRAIGKAELVEHLWPDSHVTESSLFECINDARQVLGDSARRSRYIQTVRKVGYKWVYSDVLELEKPVETGKKKSVGLSFVAVLLSLVALWWLLPTKPTPVESIYIASIGSENDGNLRAGLLTLLQNRLEENLGYTVHCETGDIPPSTLDQVKQWAEKAVGDVDRILVIQVEMEGNQPHLRYVYIDEDRAKLGNNGPKPLLKTWADFNQWLTTKAGLKLPDSAIPATAEFLESYCQGADAFQQKQFVKARANWVPLVQNESPLFLIEDLASAFLFLNQTDEALELAEKLINQPQLKWRTSGLFFKVWCHLLRKDDAYIESLGPFIQTKIEQNDPSGLQSLIVEHAGFLVRKKNYSKALEIFEHHFESLLGANASGHQPYQEFLITFSEQLKAQEAWMLYERSIRLYLRFTLEEKNAEPLIYAIGAAVRVLKKSGREAEAIHLLEEFSTLVEKRMPEKMGDFDLMATLVYYEWGAYQQALSLSESSMRVIANRGEPIETIRIMQLRSWLLFDLGFWDRGEEQALRAKELALESEHGRAVGDLQILLALIQHQKTNVWPDADQLVSYLKNAGSPSTMALLIAIRERAVFQAVKAQFQAHPNFPNKLPWVSPFIEGLGFRAESRWEQALKLFKQAYDLAESNPGNMPWIRTNCSYLIAQAQAELGGWSFGLPFIEEAFKEYPQDFRHWFLLARYYHHLEQPQKAASVLAEARNRLGSAWREEWTLKKSASPNSQKRHSNRN